MEANSLLSELRTVLPAEIDDEAAARLLGCAQALAIPARSDTRSQTLIKTPQLVELLGVSRQAIHKSIRAGRIIAIQVGRQWEYPLWQVSDRGIILPGVASAQSRLVNRVDPERCLHWWNTKSAALENLSPAQWLLHGRDQARVVAAAERFARKIAAN